MKANDLMICDYVFVEPSGQRICIAAIHNGKVGYHSVEYRLEWVRMGCLRPIPLTEELCVKIGYAVSNSPLRNGMASVSVYEYNGDIYMGRVLHIGRRKPVTSLHELQQLLRIGGIEKDVEL